ncbi:MAG: P-II family nitrogen regulator [Fimbriimonadales bacterium]|nr:P-II family nitrogen regulator [Fimbriimonadales bacterium]
MVRIIAFIRPHKLEQVKSAIASLGITGMNVADARGTGNSPERSHWLGGDAPALPIKSRVEVVVSDDLMEPIVRAIEENARTGEPGDGKIFVERIADAVRIRTGERGETAV